MSTITRSKFAALAAGVLFLAAATPAAAADSVNVTVNATVVGVCKFFTDSSTPEVNITNTGTGSNIDPSKAGPAEGTVDINYRCSNGTTPSFTVPSPATVTCTVGTPCSGSPTMDATMTSTNEGAGSGMGGGQNKKLTVKGSIAVSIYADKPVGAYTGTILVEVSP
jgi:hypothetical protein